MKKLILPLLALLIAVPLQAQDGDWELGLDAALTHSIVTDGEDVTSVDVPLARVRAGLFVSDVVSIEPVLAFSTVSIGENNVTDFDFATSVQYHFSSDVRKVRFYAAPNVGIDLSHRAFNPQPEPPGDPFVIVINDGGNDDHTHTCRSTKPGKQWPCIVDQGFWSGNTENRIAATCGDCSTETVDGTDTQFLLGMTAGAKIPIADKFALRVEAGYSHGFTTDERNATDNLLLAVGGSFFIW
jgi:hypothetical protein